MLIDKIYLNFLFLEKGYSYFIARIIFIFDIFKAGISDAIAVINIDRKNTVIIEKVFII